MLRQEMHQVLLGEILLTRQEQGLLLSREIIPILIALHQEVQIDHQVVRIVLQGVHIPLEALVLREAHVPQEVLVVRLVQDDNN